MKWRGRNNTVYNYDFVYLVLKIEYLSFPKDKVAGFNIRKDIGLHNIWDVTTKTRFVYLKFNFTWLPVCYLTTLE